MCQLQLRHIKIDAVVNALRHWRPRSSVTGSYLPEEIVQKIMSNFATVTRTSFRTYHQFISPAMCTTNVCPCTVMRDMITTCPDNPEIMCSRFADPNLYRCLHHNTDIFVTNQSTGMDKTDLAKGSSSHVECPLLGRKFSMHSHAICRDYPDERIDDTTLILNNIIDEFYPVVVLSSHGRMHTYPPISQHGLIEQEHVVSLTYVAPYRVQYRSVIRINNDTTLLLGYEVPNIGSDAMAFTEIGTSSGLPYTNRRQVTRIPSIRVYGRWETYSAQEITASEATQFYGCSNVSPDSHIREVKIKKFIVAVELNLCQITVNEQTLQVTCTSIMNINGLMPRAVPNDALIYHAYNLVQLGGPGMFIEYKKNDEVIDTFEMATNRPHVRIFYSYISNVYILVYSTGYLVAIDCTSFKHVGELYVPNVNFAMWQFYPHADVLAIATTKERWLFVVYNKSERLFLVYERFFVKEDSTFGVGLRVPEYESADESGQKTVKCYHRIYVPFNKYFDQQFDTPRDTYWNFNFVQTTRGNIVVIVPAMMCSLTHLIKGRLVDVNECSFSSESTIMIGNMFELHDNTYTIPMTTSSSSHTICNTISWPNDTVSSHKRDIYTEHEHDGDDADQAKDLIVLELEDILTAEQVLFNGSDDDDDDETCQISNDT